MPAGNACLARAAVHEPDGDRECASARSDAPRDVDGGGATPAGENENENENAILKIRMRLEVRLGFFHSYFSTSAASSDIQVRDGRPLMQSLDRSNSLPELA